MGIPITPTQLGELKSKGLIDDTQDWTSGPPDERPKLVPMAYVHDNTYKQVTGSSSAYIWTLPIITASEANGRDWKARSNRTKQARDVVSKAFGPVMLDGIKKWYHQFKGSLEIEFIRLGGRKLDAANLGTALKATEDAVALMLGADDGDPRWRAKFDQEPGGLIGVRVTIRMGETLKT